MIEKNIIEILCKQQNKTIKGVSRKLNIAEYDLTKWNQRKSSVFISQAIALSKEFGVTLNELFIDEETEVIDISYLDEAELIVARHIINEKTQIDKIMKNRFLDHFSIGSRIKQIREDFLQLTRLEMSSLFNVSPSAIQQWEMGPDLQTMGRIIAIAELSHITLDYFIIPNYPLSVSLYNMSKFKVGCFKSFIELCQWRRKREK